MRLGVMVLACGLLACGRVGFDARGDGGSSGGDGPDPGLPDALSPSLFAWYRFEDDIAGFGMARDASGHDRTLTCSPPPRCPQSAAGRSNSDLAAGFTGNESLTWQPSGTEADLPAFTAAAWVKLDRRPTDFEMVVARPLVGGSGNSFALDHSSAGRLEYYSQGGASLFSATTIAIGDWTHLAIAYDGSSKYVFINGALQGSGSTGVPLTYDTSPLIIGADITAGTVDHFLIGSISDVMIFDRALYEGEIEELAQ